MSRSLVSHSSSPQLATYSEQHEPVTPPPQIHLMPKEYHPSKDGEFG